MKTDVTTVDARNDARATAQFDAIIEDAHEIAEEGNFELEIESLQPGTREKLEEAGFKVTYNSDYGGPGNHTISWKKK